MIILFIDGLGGIVFCFRAETALFSGGLSDIGAVFRIVGGLFRQDIHSACQRVFR